MEQSRKHLKMSSIVVLVFSLATIFDLIAGLIDLNDATIPEGAPNNILLITKIVLMVIWGILLLPQIYIGFKGIKIANNPDSSKIHIIVSIIVFIFTALSLVSPAISLIKGSSNESILTILRIAVEASVYYDYIVAARAVANGK